MQRAIDETSRRRAIQQAYNEREGITPETIKKAIRESIESEVSAHRTANEACGKGKDEATYVTEEFIGELEAEMLEAAEQLDFERAAALRDRIADLKAEVRGEPKKKSVRGKKSQRGRRKSSARVPRPKKL